VNSGKSLCPVVGYLARSQTTSIVSTESANPLSHNGLLGKTQSTNDTVNIMKFAKMAIFLALTAAGAQAFADDSHATAVTPQIPAENYTYATKLDIQKVIAVTEIGDKCGPVPMQMTYEDSHGQQHVLNYQVMGTGCSNG